MPASYNSTSSWSSYAGEDDMANGWGFRLVEVVSPLKGTKSKLDSEIRKTITGFRLQDVVESGTTANERAIQLATQGNTDLCLFGMGSYVGGVGSLQYMTSTALASSRQLSLVQSPAKCTIKCRQQTVALPYHIPHKGLDDKELHQIEDMCLHAFHVKVACAALQGRRFQTFLVEYILSGTGGELSNRFLGKLAVILKQYNISVIADEIMTGGRVGPAMTQTTNKPQPFVDCVAYITLGKCFGCGLVLDKVQTYAENRGRGTTTEMKFDEAYTKFVLIRDLLATDAIQEKRRMVVHRMGLSELPNSVWGVGLLMFFAKCRTHKAALRCRGVPTLDTNPRTKIVLGCTPTNWNRITVHEHLIVQCNAWLKHAEELYMKECTSPYIVVLAKYLTNETDNTTTIYADEISASIQAFMELQGLHQSVLVQEYKERRKRRLGSSGAGRCTAGHESLLMKCLNDANSSSNGFLTATVKHKKRRKAYLVNFSGARSP